MGKHNSGRRSGKTARPKSKRDSGPAKKRARQGSRSKSSAKSEARARLIEDPDRPGVFRYDLDARPAAIPRGAIRADPRKQNYGYGGPVYWWSDIERRCSQCEEMFVFSAAEQKFWFESLQFNQNSTAVRCVSCRRRRRSDKAIMRRHEHVSDLRTSENDVEVIEYVIAHLEFIERFDRGDPALAVAAARRARRLNKDWAEPLYWEARAQQAAGRLSDAADVYRRFLDHEGTAQKRLRDDARRRLSGHAVSR